MKKYLSRLAAAVLAALLLVTPACALTVDQARELLEEYYYYDLPEEAYQVQTMDGLVQLLDPYTLYMTPAQYAAFLGQLEGDAGLVGIGISIEYTEAGILVERVFPGGPAAEGGLKAGDLIVAADGVSCVPAGERHRDLILGEEGSRVTLTVLRDGVTRTFTLTRRPVVVPSVLFSEPEEGLVYIECSTFGSDTAQLFRDGLEEYGDADLLLLDLRGNTGGYTDSALDMLAALNGPGYYLYYEDGDGEVYPQTRTGQAVTDAPLVILLDAYSASASELLSAGVRDAERGVSVGTRTYGKGVAQILLDGDSDPDYFGDDAMKLTAYRFYTPSGSTTDRIGVVPTLLVDNEYAEAVALALHGGSQETSSLCVMAGTDLFYVDPDTDDATLAALLSALSPQIRVFYNDGMFSQCSPAEAALGLGIDYEDRWFSDVADSPYAFAINAMGAYRLLNGTDPGLFSPQEALTRAQLCVMLSRVLNVEYTGGTLFDDVAPDAWYAPGVNAMAALDLVGGIGDNLFDPEGPLTQEELLTILGRVARYLNFALDTYGAVVDEHPEAIPWAMADILEPWSEWARSGVAVLAWGLEDALEEDGDLLYAPLGRLDPSAPVLREQAAAGMYALLSGLWILP